MSVNRNRRKFDKGISNSDYKKLMILEIYPLYWDEGIIFHSIENKNKKFTSERKREFKTWKSKRKQQWENMF